MLLAFKGILLGTLLLDDPVMLLAFKGMLLGTLFHDDLVMLLPFKDILLGTLFLNAAGMLLDLKILYYERSNLMIFSSCWLLKIHVLNLVSCFWNIHL